MLEVNGLSVDIGPVNILRDVSLRLESKQMVGFIGRNGAGKTTFLRAVMGLLKAKAGTISLDDTELLALPAHHRAGLGIGYMPEDRKLVPNLTVEENIKTPVWSVGVENWEARLEWIYTLIPEAVEFRHRPSTSLSGGQQKLAALARALMVGNRMLLLDEPSEGIAPALAKRMSDILANLKAEGVSILIAESNTQHCADLLDSMYVVERGSVEAA
ncbi:MAG: ATP-binding cassette domain-containing protein [Alphaproteobacteria bacterium]|mgnify:CR=1 FL=1|jgi:branched-chain amino acid transport system ATP-binding protein|nr:ATP-binding cassette domain-containing protein [Alphaproteobacteria bacterium]